MGLFRRNKKPETAQPIDEAQQKILNGIATKLDLAEKCTDAGEKFLTVQRIAAETDSHMWKAQESVDARAAIRGAASYLGISLPGAAGITILGVSLHLPPLALLLFTVPIAGGLVAQNRQQHKTRRHLTEENRSFIGALEAQKTRASDLSTALLSKDMHAIAESKYFPAILNDLPNNLRADFAAALSGELAVVKEPSTTQASVDDPTQAKPARNTFNL